MCVNVFINVHLPQVCLLSGAKRPCTCPTAGGRSTFGHEAPVYMPTGRRPVYFWVRSARVHAPWLQAGLLSGTKRPCTVYMPTGRSTFGREPCTCPPAAGWSTLGHEVPVYMPTGQSTFGAPVYIVFSTVGRIFPSNARNGF